jgi:hypothetical protein
MENIENVLVDQNIKIDKANMELRKEMQDE